MGRCIFLLRGLKGGLWGLLEGRDRGGRDGVDVLFGASRRCVDGGSV